MSMSKKDFVSLANELGTALRMEGITDADQLNTNSLALRLVNGVTTTCRQANYQFSYGTFFDHMWDVANGRRDLNGRKVTR